MITNRQAKHNAVSGIARGMADASPMPTVTVLGYTLAGDGVARIVGEVVHNQGSRKDHALIGKALASAFDNKLRPVANSFHSLSKSAYTERFEGVVRVNTQSVPYKDDMAGFRSFSSNIFMDDEEKMWVLRKTEAGEILVKNTGIEDHESLKGLMDVVCSGGYSLSSEFKRDVASLSTMQHSVTGGDFVQYISSSSDETKFGFVVATAEDGKLVVLSADLAFEDGEVVSASAVINKYDTEPFPDVEFSEQEKMDNAVATARGVIDIKFLLDYYRKVFQRSPEFFKQFEARVRQHAFM